MIRKFGRNASLGLLVLVGAALPTVSWQAGGGAAPAAPPSPVPTVDLHRADVIRFSAPGPAAVLSTMKCGPGGDIYVIYSSTSSQEMAAIPIRRISVFSRSVTEYAVPAISGYRRLARLSFDVSADGSLYALLQAIPQTGAERKSDPAYLDREIQRRRQRRLLCCGRGDTWRAHPPDVVSYVRSWKLSGVGNHCPENCRRDDLAGSVLCDV